MTAIALTGGIGEALSHFAAVGAAAIARQAGYAAYFHWSDESVPVVMLDIDLDIEGLATVVREHAREHSSEDSWAARTASGGPRDGSGLFSVRAKGVGTDEWTAYGEQRRRSRRALVGVGLDERLVTALGEPAWWLIDAQGRSLDDGGSRWEMKTRNRGEEFFVHRFVPLGRAVAQREVGDVAAGMTGRTVIDELGSGATSRTATGLRTPGPTDSAVAWCALWGLHVMPTIARRTTVSQSACVWPRQGVHPRMAVLPVFTEPVSPRRYGEICASVSLDRAGVRAGGQSDPITELRADVARKWLAEQGVRALVRFEVKKGGSSSAPERQILAGELEVLNGRD